eukprot:539677-Pelagomonas_calceolata.AAC.1
MPAKQGSRVSSAAWCRLIFIISNITHRNERRIGSKKPRVSSTQSYSKKRLMGIWKITGSTRPHNLAVISVFVFNRPPSDDKFVGIKESYTIGVPSQAVIKERGHHGCEHWEKDPPQWTYLTEQA